MVETSEEILTRRIRDAEQAIEERFAGMLKYASSEGIGPVALDTVCRGVNHDIMERLRVWLKMALIDSKEVNNG